MSVVGCPATLPVKLAGSGCGVGAAAWLYAIDATPTVRIAAETSTLMMSPGRKRRPIVAGVGSRAAGSGQPAGPRRGTRPTRRRRSTIPPVGRVPRSGPAGCLLPASTSVRSPERRRRDVVDSPDLAGDRDDVSRVADHLERGRAIEAGGDHAKRAVGVHLHQ